MQAVAQGYYYAAANPNEASRILLKYAPGLNYDLVTQSQQFLSPRYLDDEGRFGFTLNDYTNSYTQWLYDNNLINQFIPSDKIFSNRYLPNSNPLKK
jgi:ABC-type nitrate/sulfonate/bicarbonate transport system substrate-binding protein